MVSDLPYCPRYGSRRLIRFGIVAGRQRWRCKRCRYQFTRLEGHGTPEPTKRAAVSLYGYGLAFNTVATCSAPRRHRCCAGFAAISIITAASRRQ
jgi:transposase-like protein